MFEFYEFNTFNICVVLISIFVIYFLLSKFFKNKPKDSTDNTEESNTFSLEYLFIAVILSICISLGISYLMSGKDEALLTDNYWENTNLE